MADTFTIDVVSIFNCIQLKTFKYEHVTNTRNGKEQAAVVMNDDFILQTKVMYI